MKNIVITGGTRGIGRGLAEEFIKKGCQVLITGRSASTTQEAVEEIKEKFGKNKVHGINCDVTDRKAVENLWDEAVRQMGKVDIWINNAGVSHEQLPSWELSTDEVERTLLTNLHGTINGASIAMKGMLLQGFGQIYNMEGIGSRKPARDGMSIYGVTKAAVTRFTDQMVQEAKGKSVQVCYLSPGMVITDMVMDRLIMDPEGLEKIKPILNIIASRVEEVTPVLAEKVLNNQKHGARIAFSSQWKMFCRFILSPLQKRDVFS